jgi:hypothetical protein
MPVIGLENVEHPEYGVITVDLDLLRDSLPGSKIFQVMTPASRFVRSEKDC